MSQFSKRETCETIMGIAGQLAILAHNAELDVLAHLLKMTELEAQTILTDWENARPGAPDFPDQPQYDATRHVIQTLMTTGA